MSGESNRSINEGEKEEHTWSEQIEIAASELVDKTKELIEEGNVRRLITVLCWSGICRLGSIQIGSLGLINTLPFDHESGSPESLLGLRPDINKPPIIR